MRRYLQVMVLAAVAVFLGGFGGTSPAEAADQYTGDTAIYSAQGTTGVQPNVLVIIDNSLATEHIASGVAYDNAEDYDTAPGYDPWSIYVGDNQGQFSRVEVANSDRSLSNLTCGVSIVKDTLLSSGTYSGSGIVDYPNLNGGACATGPKGATYALGNYLNYVNATPGSSGDIIVTHDLITRKGNSGNTATDPDRKFLLTVSHLSASTNEPGALDSDWQSYWTLLDSHDTRSATDNWTSDTSYSVSAGFVGKSQREIVYEALETVLGGARYAVNFAAMTYGGNNHGGKVIDEMADLTADSDFNPFLARLPGSGDATSEPVLDSATARPQAEALWDAGYYFGANYTPITLSTGTRVPTDLAKACYNNIIFITNGLSNGDGGSASTIWQIGDADHDDWPGEATHSAAVYGEGSHYLDDVAQYLNDVYGITTHMVLAFQGEDDLVHTAALNGGGKFYNTYDANSLAKAMTELLTNIVSEVNSAFVAPVVPTSPENRTYSGSRVYLGFFKPLSNQSWSGNLKKYAIDGQNQILDVDDNVATNSSDGSFKDASIYGSYTAKSFWSNAADGAQVEAGGAGAKLLPRMWNQSNHRNIYTHLGTADLANDSDNQFVPSNNGLDAELGAADATEADDIIKFVHGLNSLGTSADQDSNGVPDNEENRDWVLGDILHSKPLVVNYNTYTFNKTNEESCTTNKAIVYVGANDGMLHAFRDCDGEELWAFIPPDVLGDLKLLTEANHTCFVDGTPTAYIYDKDNDGNIGTGPETGDTDLLGADNGSNDKVVLLFGLRRGGGAYYSLDVTNPEAPLWMWQVDGSATGFEELGETWSTPMLGKVKVDVSGTIEDKVVAFVGAGYDHSNEDGRFGATQGYTNADVVTPTSDSGANDSTGTTVRSRKDDDDPVTNNPKGRGVYAIEVATLNSSGVPSFGDSGSQVWEFSYSTTGNNLFNRKRMKYPIPSDVTVLDTDYDGYTDRLYVGDTGGQLWRISSHSTTNPLPPYANPIINETNKEWFGKRIFEANALGTDPDDSGTGSQGRKFFYRPSVTFEKDSTGKSYIALFIGSGDRAHPLNYNVEDRMYAIYDRDQRTNQYITEDNLEDVTENLLQAASPTADPETCSASDTSIKCILERLNSDSNFGWYIDLDEHTGEKVLAAALAFNKTAYYTSYAPNTAAPENSCDPGNLGISRLYAVNYKTGESVLNFNEGNDLDAENATSNNQRALSDEGKVLRRSDRSVDLGVGIPSGLVMIMPPGGDAEILIGCGGGICSKDPVVGGTIFPIYWMQL